MLFFSVYCSCSLRRLLCKSHLGLDNQNNFNRSFGVPAKALCSSTVDAPNRLPSSCSLGISEVLSVSCGLLYCLLKRDIVGTGGCISPSLPPFPTILSSSFSLTSSFVVVIVIPTAKICPQDCLSPHWLLCPWCRCAGALLCTVATATRRSNLLNMKRRNRKRKAIHPLLLHP